MKIQKSNHQIMSEINGEEMLKFIERCGRECYQSTHKIEEGSAPKFVAMLIKNGHTSVLEHEKITVHFDVDRGVTHEEVRHRMASFSQESTRYCNYLNEQFGTEIQVIGIRPGMELDTKMREMSTHLKDAIYNEWQSAMIDAERHYLRLIQLGATPQIARGVLPNSLKSGIVITANLREWRLIFGQRTSKAAHPQMREVMIPLLADLAQKIPVVFDDLLDKVDEESKKILNLA